MNGKPLVIELFAGRFGWSRGFIAEGFEAVGFDIVHEPWHGPVPEGCHLVLQDVLTLHGSQFRDAACIVASPPCQAYSYRAMPWKRAKALPPPDNALFEACFRIQREASEAAGRYIPMVVENVKGAQPWVGRAKWHHGSFYLWGDVPALMPFTQHRKGLAPVGPSAGNGNGATSWFFGSREDQRDFRKNEDGEYTRFGQKNNGGSWFAVAHNTTSGHSQNPDGRLDGIKQPGHSGRAWFADPDVAGHLSSRSAARAAASAVIAEIPFELAHWIARCFKPA